MLRRALDAFARMDPQAAATIIKDDLGIDDRFRAVLRQLITFMMEDPRTISASLDCVWVAKAIERIGDHAKNVAEHVIFISQGGRAPSVAGRRRECGSKTMTAASILVIEDEPAIQELVAYTCSTQGYTVRRAIREGGP